MDSGRIRLETLCEYTKNPLGIQNRNPRFSWRCCGDYLDFQYQSAYQVLVWEGSGGFARPEEPCWDSGVVNSAKSVCVEYGGPPLKSATRYCWKARTWSPGCSEPVESDEAWFETGLFEAGDWHAEWMGQPSPQRGVAPLFRNGFMLAGEAKTARVYICGLGYYRLYINGVRVGDRELEPGWTDYRKRVLYSVYDVTGLLHEGENAVGIELGEGWHGHEHGSFAHFMGHQPHWLAYPKALFQMDIETRDGQSLEILSGEGRGWVCCDGPIRRNGIYDGETYDARLEVPGWNDAGYDNAPELWQDACRAEPPGGRLVAQMLPPVRRVEEFEPAGCARRPEGGAVYDMGRNFAGRVRIKAQGLRGKALRMLYAETLNSDGTANRLNLRGALAEDKYVFKGKSVEEYEPVFTYHGFRYVQLEADSGIEVLELHGVALHSDVSRIGRFSSPDRLLNRICEAAASTEKYNLHSIPTDCPQRDERMAWLNDMTVRCEQAMYTYDMPLFYEKWLDDIADAQDATGSIPDTAPHVYGGNPAFHVSSCFVVIPWLLYRFSGDTQILQRFYTGMKQYVLFLQTQREDGLIKSGYFGDWAPPKAECILGEAWDALPANTPHQLITTGYFYYDCRLMRRIALRLGRQQDAELFNDLAEDARCAINVRYLDADAGRYGPGDQASNAFALFLGIVPESLRENIYANLVRDIADGNGYHITTGNQTTKCLFDVLGGAQGEGTALKLLRSTDYPSIGYMLDRGATTIWERWEEETGPGMNSHNHPMNAAFASWFFTCLGGLRLAESDMENGKIEIAPCLLPELGQAEIRYESVRGGIAVRWTVNISAAAIELEIPWNTKASVALRAPEGWGPCEISLNGATLPQENWREDELNRPIVPLSLPPGWHSLKLVKGNHKQ